MDFLAIIAFTVIASAAANILTTPSGKSGTAVPAEISNDNRYE